MKIISHITVFDQDNIDTDQIIPARFLKISSREGFGKYLFHDLRLGAKGEKNGFFLNAGSLGSILLAGDNFGCGSSREHAAWALKDHGFDAIISTSFSDIFRNNALNNALLPVEIPASRAAYLREFLAGAPDSPAYIDVEKQELGFVSGGPVSQFPLEPFRKLCLLKGSDPVNYLVSIREKIRHFEEKRIKFSMV